MIAVYPDYDFSFSISLHSALVRGASGRIWAKFFSTFRKMSKSSKNVKKFEKKSKKNQLFEKCQKVLKKVNFFQLFEKSVTHR